MRVAVSGAHASLCEHPIALGRRDNGRLLRQRLRLPQNQHSKPHCKVADWTPGTHFSTQPLFLNSKPSLSHARTPPPGGPIGPPAHRHYRHIGRPAAAERVAERALKVQGSHQAAIRAQLDSIRIRASGQNIGVLAPLSGKFGAAGRLTLEAVKAALQGTPFKVVTFDTEGLESKAVEESARSFLKVASPPSSAR